MTGALTPAPEEVTITGCGKTLATGITLVEGAVAWVVVTRYVRAPPTVILPPPTTGVPVDDVTRNE